MGGFIAVAAGFAMMSPTHGTVNSSLILRSSARLWAGVQGLGPTDQAWVVSKILCGADENHYEVGLQPASVSSRRTAADRCGARRGGNLQSFGDCCDDSGETCVKVFL
jgi:hypothetical protein